MTRTAPADPATQPLSTPELARRPPLALRILRGIPILGPLVAMVIRDIRRDINTIFWLLPVVVLGLVLAVQAWGLAALTMAALAMVPLMFAFFIAISWP